MKTDKLTQDRLKECLDYNLQSGAFTWLAMPAKKSYLIGSIAGRLCKRTGYRRIQIDGQSYQAHRLSWLYVYGEWPEQMIDHIDGNRDNNAIANLRDVSAKQNSQNQKKAQKDNRTGFLGVHQQAGRSNFYAMIAVNRQNQYLGTFDCPQEAHEAYLSAKRQLHEGCTI